MEDNMSKSPKKRKPLSQLSLEGCSVAPKKPRNGIVDNSCQKRAGFINQMVLKNFMCHSLLEVNFTNNVTIVIGKNGSGKSAILTALIVGLGGKATLTNRGSSVKGFVKAGRNSGSIQIELYNEGPLAYRPQTYGKRITIIRNISASGSSSYRIRSEEGAVVSTQAKELQRITTGLNIQIDNPVCILNQDTSRNFLSSNDPKQKYILYRRATGLETLSEQYVKIAENRRESENTLSEKEADLQKLQNEIKGLKRKIDSHKTIANLKEKKQNLHREIVWAKVRDSEVELSELERKLEKYESKSKNLEETCNKRKERIKALKENCRELEREILEVKDAVEVQKKPQLDCKNVLDKLYDTYNAKKRAKVLVQSDIESKRQDEKYLQQEIANANENISKVEQKKLQRVNDINQLQKQIKGFDEYLDTSRNDLFQIKTDISRKEEEDQNLQREITEVDRKITNETSSLQAIKRDSGNDLLVYGQHMPKVKQMIAQYKNQFQQEPRGPLGCYIKLKDKKWAIAVESFLSPGLLGAFTVDNDQDSRLLIKIFNQVLGGRRQPMIITSKFIFKRHDVRKNLVQAPPDCLSMYDVIEINDVVVSNCIVDQSEVESILLIGSTERAMELLSDENNVPHKCIQGITVKGDRYYPDPNYRTYGSRYHQARYLQVDASEYMRQLQETISELTARKKMLLCQKNAFRADLQKQITKRNELETKVRQLQETKFRSKKRLDELTLEAEPEAQNVLFLEQELVEVKSNINEKLAAFEKIANELKEMKAQVVEKKEQMRQLQNSTAGLETRMEKLQAKIRENKVGEVEIGSGEDYDNRRLTEFEGVVNETRAEVVVKQQTIHKGMEEAGAIGERPEELRTVPEISQEISEVDRTVTRITSDAENITDVLTKYTTMQEKFKTALALIKCLQNDVSELNKAYQKRTRHCTLTESYFIALMKHSFKQVLEYRQFKGNIDINIQDKKLDLVVIPQQGSQGQTSTSNLSGGERSFSTIAFLYSLWQCMNFPFYFLDEFDVYMDKLNRSKVLDILLHQAKAHPDIQYVFLTPQDVSFVKEATILRLQDPERFNVQ